jgi:spore coat protein U-like protein
MKLIRLALAGGALCASGAAMGQATVYNISAQVAPVCGVYSSSGPVIDVNFGSLANVATTATVSVGAGSATYRCTSRSGFTRTITSRNNGWLTLEGNPTTDVTRRIRFDMSHGGGNGLSFGMRQLTAPLSRNFPSTPVWLNGQTGTVTFQAFGVRGAPTATGVPGTTVRAGNYRDTVTITITSN